MQRNQWRITNSFQNVNVFFLLALRYLVAAGSPAPYGTKTEIVDLSDPKMSCLLDDMQYRHDGAGGLLGITPIICGGSGSSDRLDECIVLGASWYLSRKEWLKFGTKVKHSFGKRGR